MHLPKAVLLDRDGVINFDSPDYILAPDQWRPIPGSLDAIGRMTAAGIPIAICSNQSGLGRGMMDQDSFEAIHAKMLLCIEDCGGRIDHVAYCRHGPDDHCNCRKPKPALLIESLQAFGLENAPQTALMIGDSIRDVQAAHAAGVPAWLVQSGYGDKGAILEKSRAIMPDIRVFSDLATAVNAILGET